MNTPAQSVAEREAQEAMWREMGILNTTSDEPMSRARFDEVMSEHVDLDSLPDISEAFDLSAKFDLEQELSHRNVFTPDKVPGLVTIEGIIDLAIPVGYFTPACWASGEMNAWLQTFANKVAYIHQGKMPEFKGRTIGELVEFAITYKRPEAKQEKLPEVKFKRLGVKATKWYELDDQTMPQDKAILLGLVYETSKKELWQVSGDQSWIPVTETQAKRFLKIDEYIFGVPGTDEWTGTCSDLLSRLMRSAANPAELKYFTTKNIGENLKKLEKSLAPSVKGRIKSKTSRGRTVYTIKTLVVGCGGV